LKHELHIIKKKTSILIFNSVMSLLNLKRKQWVAIENHNVYIQ